MSQLPIDSNVDCNTYVYYNHSPLLSLGFSLFEKEFNTLKEFNQKKTKKHKQNKTTTKQQFQIQSNIQENNITKKKSNVKEMQT